MFFNFSFYKIINKNDKLCLFNVFIQNIDKINNRYFEINKKIFLNIFIIF